MGDLLWSILTVPATPLSCDLHMKIIQKQTKVYFKEKECVSSLRIAKNVLVIVICIRYYLLLHMLKWSWSKSNCLHIFHVYENCIYI